MKYVHNGIKTAKYNVVTFLPIFLFEMFSRLSKLAELFLSGSSVSSGALIMQV